MVYAGAIDKQAIETYKCNFDPEEVCCADICEAQANAIPACDIVIGGFPCQSFSRVNLTKIHLRKEEARSPNVQRP